MEIIRILDRTFMREHLTMEEHEIATENRVDLLSELGMDKPDSKPRVVTGASLGIALHLFLRALFVNN